MIRLAPLLLLLPVACGGEPEAPAPAGPEGGPKVETMLGEVPGIVYVGEWTSKDCPNRTYPRNIVIQADHTYAGIDLVSPCPPGTQCAWSGMVGFAGIWKQEGTKLLLREIGGPIQPGSPHPTEFTATMEGKLRESQCDYEKGLFVPPGYTEDQVRPRVPGEAKPGAAGAEGTAPAPAEGAPATEGAAPTEGAPATEGTAPAGAAPVAPEGSI